MGLDIRWPIGLMFTLIGVMLTGFGVFKRTESISLGVNVNLVWGIVLLLVGMGMLLGAIAGKKKT